MTLKYIEDEMYDGYTTDFPESENNNPDEQPDSQGCLPIVILFLIAYVIYNFS